MTTEQIMRHLRIRALDVLSDLNPNFLHDENHISVDNEAWQEETIFMACSLLHQIYNAEDFVMMKENLNKIFQLYPTEIAKLYYFQKEKERKQKKIKGKILSSKPYDPRGGFYDVA